MSIIYVSLLDHCEASGQADTAGEGCSYCNSGSAVRSVSGPGIAFPPAAAVAGCQWESKGKCAGQRRSLWQAAPDGLS